MNLNTSLKNAIVSFAYTGVMAPHRKRIDYEAPRVTSTSVPVRQGLARA